MGQKLPIEWLTNPLVMLDGGRGVAESVFLERWRKFLYDEKAAHPWKNAKVRKNFQNWVFVMYGDRRQWARHGAYPIPNEADPYQVRPVRWVRQLAPAGFFASVAMFEDGARRYPVDAPWRYALRMWWRRAGLLYLEPPERDETWMFNHWDEWDNKDHYDGIHLGVPFHRRLQPSWLEKARRLWAYDDLARKALADSVSESWRILRIPWEGWWRSDSPCSGAVAAPSWKDTTCVRYPDFGQILLKDARLDVRRPENNATWKDFLQHMDAMVYLVATKQEAHTPWDVLIALSHGATLVAPDLAGFRALRGRKVLWPCREYRSGRCEWNFHEVRAWAAREFRRLFPAQQGQPSGARAPDSARIPDGGRVGAA